jgi:hypothetical protein
MVAVQAVVVLSMLEVDVLVFGNQLASALRRLERTVAFVAFVGESGAV